MDYCISDHRLWFLWS